MKDDPSKSNANPPEISPQISRELEKLVPERQIREKVIATFTQRFWGGPLPTPEALKEYNAVIPGCAERIVKMAENQSAHRIGLENKVIDSQLSESKRGQYIGLVVALVCIGAAIWLALAGHDPVAGILAGGTVIGLVTVFVVGKKEQKRDLERKSGN